MTTQKVEFILCWTDHTWTTETWDVPDHAWNDGEIEEWATLHADGMVRDDPTCKYKDLVYIGLYCLDPVGV